jgi:hypothetical protein
MHQHECTNNFNPMIYFNYLRYKITLNAIKIKEKPRKFILAQINSLKLGKIYLRVLQQAQKVNDSSLLQHFRR